jgi:hypothetical protein
VEKNKKMDYKAYYNSKKQSDRIKVSDWSQPIKIGLMVIFGIYFVIWSILILKKL